eukprot:TRINITY_DN2927_c0_g1_i1.p1 TRINITY_DN2927_c0_g1~~TRINITY_DN2927_c0_g1_i1.p1  ORF type:complete len:182 (-),score=44.85 TRINITY_DN2927_c0_g1_i1:85-630(-)
MAHAPYHLARSPSPTTTPAGLALFDDAHSFMRNINDEMEAIRKFVDAEDEKRRVEVEELRRDQEQERFERRDELNKLRYEFEEFVTKKLSKVLQEAQTTLKRSGVRDDSLQQQQLNSLMSDFDKLRENLFSVQSAWGKLVHNCVSPAHQEALARREHLERQEEQARNQHPPAHSLAAQFGR